MKPLLAPLLRSYVYRSTPWRPARHFATLHNPLPQNNGGANFKITPVYHMKDFHSSSICHKLFPTNKAQNKGPIKHEKSLAELQVLLLDDSENELGQMSKKEALHMADYKRMKLAEIKGLPSELPVFKLMSSEEYSKVQKEARLKKQLDKKAVPKVFKLKGKITPHDLSTKIKQMVKVLEKGQGVKVQIQESTTRAGRPDVQGMKSVADEITSSVKDIAKSKVLRTVHNEFLEVQFTPIERIEEVETASES